MIPHRFFQATGGNSTPRAILGFLERRLLLLASLSALFFSAQVAYSQDGDVPDPIHRYSFEEVSGVTVSDTVGGADGVIRGSGYTLTGRALKLAGGDSSNAAYVDLPNGMISSLTDMTVEGWVSIDGIQTWQRIFDFGGGSAGEIISPGDTANGTPKIALGFSPEAIFGVQQAISAI